MRDLASLQPFVLFPALAEEMGLDLVNGGSDLVEFDQVDQPVRVPDDSNPDHGTEETRPERHEGRKTG